MGLKGFKEECNRFIRSFGYALNGILQVVCHERNMQIHGFIACIVLFFAWFFQLPKGDIILLLIIIGGVFSLEIMNTAIEKTVDLITKEYHPLAKLAKDTSAGAVLIFTIFAIIAGLIIFYGPVLTFFQAH